MLLRYDLNRGRSWAKPRVLPVLLLLSAWLGGSACATFVRRHEPREGRTMQSVEVRSSPAGARVMHGSVVLGVTPTVVVVPVRSRTTLIVQLDGYEAQELRLGRTVDHAAAGNLAFGLLGLNPLLGLPDTGGVQSAGGRLLYALTAIGIGLGVDHATGAAYRVPATVNVTLRPTIRLPPPRRAR